MAASLPTLAKPSLPHSISLLPSRVPLGSKSGREGNRRVISNQPVKAFKNERRKKKGGRDEVFSLSLSLGGRVGVHRQGERGGVY